MKNMELTSFRHKLYGKILPEPKRFILIGKIDQKFQTAVFTLRNDKIRIISVRRSRKQEVEAYES